MTQRRFVLPFILAFAHIGAAHAQGQPPAAAPGGTPGPAGQPLPGAAAPGAGTPGVPGVPPVPGASGSAGDSVQGIQLPDVKDPMLDPVPDAPNQLASWKDALALVRTRSTALRISRADILRTAGQTQLALAVALPKLTGSAGYNRPLLVSDLAANNAQFGRDNLGVAADLTVPVFNLKAWYDVGTAEEREKGAALAAKDAERLLFAAVASSAVTVITTSRVAESARVSLASALSLLDLTQRRFRLGAASAVDVLRAEQELSASRALIVNADEGLRRAREALGQALGDQIPWGVAETVRIEDLRGAAQNVCKPVDSLDERSDVKSAQKNVDAANRDRKSVDYRFVPTVSLSGNVNWNKDNRFPSNEHVNASIGAQLLWPIYDGGARYGERKVFTAGAEVANQQLIQIKRDATVQLSQATRGILVAQTNLEVATRTRDLAKENARLTRLAFINGSGTSFELVQQSQALREAEIDLLVKDFNLFQAHITSFLARANCAI